MQRKARLRQFELHAPSLPLAFEAQILKHELLKLLIHLALQMADHQHFQRQRSQIQPLSFFQYPFELLILALCSNIFFQFSSLLFPQSQLRAWQHGELLYDPGVHIHQIHHM